MCFPTKSSLGPLLALGILREQRRRVILVPCRNLFDLVTLVSSWWSNWLVFFGTKSPFNPNYPGSKAPGLALPSRRRLIPPRNRRHLSSQPGTPHSQLIWTLRPPLVTLIRFPPPFTIRPPSTLVWTLVLGYTPVLR